jgi:hypothetical protein
MQTHATAVPEGMGSSRITTDNADSSGSAPEKTAVPNLASTLQRSAPSKH